MKIRIKNQDKSLVTIELTGTTKSLPRGKEIDVTVETDENKVLTGPPDLLSKITSKEVEVIDWYNCKSPASAEANEQPQSEAAPAIEANPKNQGQKKTGKQDEKKPAASPLEGLGVETDPKKK